MSKEPSKDKGCVTFCTPAKPCYKCRYNALVADYAELESAAADERESLRAQLADTECGGEAVVTALNEAADRVVAKLQADLAQARAEAAVIVEVLRELDGFARGVPCAACNTPPYTPHLPGCRIGCALSSDLAEQGRRMLAVVEGARRWKAEGKVFPLLEALANLDQHKEPINGEEEGDTQGRDDQA